ncbi:DsbE family thiol:disulfide interchange protein [Microvirga sp. W0021]|uniref:DsbE family thiol:disulfide interchange protein n=1 Tax=Hohaiivirga grylli TaxID=3133970 RepID=A0ABV0BJ22_9HYPH
MSQTETPPEKTKRSYIYLLPLAVFGILLVLLWFGLGGFSQSGRNPSELTWVLQGKPVPNFNLTPLNGLKTVDGQQMPGLKTEDFRGKISIVNFWGSWCVPCRAEHPGLMKLAEIAKQKNVQFVSINYKDQPAENPLAFLRELGNPFSAVGVDNSGRAGIDFGVYGVPETFIIGPDAIFFEKHVGPLLPVNFDSFIAKLEAAIAKYPEAVKP